MAPEQQQAEPTFPVVTVTGLTREEFDAKHRDGATNIVRISGGYFEVISIVKDASAAVLATMQAAAQEHPKMIVLTNAPNGRGERISIDPLIALFDEQRKEIGA